MKCFVCMDVGSVFMEEMINGIKYHFCYHCDMCQKGKESIAIGKDRRTLPISKYYNTQKIAIENKKILGINT